MTFPIVYDMTRLCAAARTARQKDATATSKVSSRATLTELSPDTGFIADLVRLTQMSLHQYLASGARPMITDSSIRRQKHLN